jgi:chorismate synthase
MTHLRFFTAGESHGQGLVTIIEGMVADLPLEAEHINRELRRRQMGYGRGARMEIEQDKAEIISGVRYGLTIGSPIGLFIPNRDWQNWQKVMNVSPLEEESESIMHPRPGHTDLAGVIKYGLKDIRPIIERASARETAARVGAGAVAKKFLEEFGVAIHSHTTAIGNVSYGQSDAISPDWQRVEDSPVRCADAKTEIEMITAIDDARAAGDTLGGIFEVIADGAPIGLGSHISWDRRLDGRIAQAIMSINAVKGVEIGGGFVSAKLKGSQAHDPIEPNPSKQPFVWRRATNRAGGIEGGISNGEVIVVKAAVKPIATLADPLPSIDLRSGEAVKAHYERSDICIVPSAGVIGEAMLALVLACAMLEKFGGDNLKETKRNYSDYIESVSALK